MMADAKRELKETVNELQEPEAELLLSFVHFLRARKAHEGRRSEQADPTNSGEWAKQLFLLLYLEERALGPESLQSLLQEVQEGHDRGWLGLSEPVLARDWNRPEEDEAWADL